MEEKTWEIKEAPSGARGSFKKMLRPEVRTRGDQCEKCDKAQNCRLT